MIKGPKGTRLIFVLLALVGAIGLVMSTRFLFSGPEDTWVCNNGVWVAHGNPSAPKPTAGCDSNVPLSETPDKAVYSFYNWYFEQTQNPLSIEKYTQSSYLTLDLKDGITDALSEMENGGYDPFLCTQDQPESFRVGRPAVTGDKATVMVEQTFNTGKRLLPVEVSLLEGDWKISAILCSEVIPQQGLSENEVQTTTVVIYYNNSERAADEGADCGLVYGVERTLDTSEPSVEDVLTSMFTGPTEDEKTAGYSSLFSSQTGDILKSAKIRNNIAYVDFKDIRTELSNATSSCGSASFMASIGETLKHNFGVQDVYYAIEENPASFYEWVQIGCSENDPKCDSAPFK